MDTSSPPKTPEGQKIPKDDSFKTCRTTRASPETRRLFRMTPARQSILSGGKPYKESNRSTSRRRKPNTSQLTSASNDTFIRCERELMFDRDSLEVGNRKCSSTPKQIAGLIADTLHQLEEDLQSVDDKKMDTPKPSDERPKESPKLLVEKQESPKLFKQPTFLKKDRQDVDDKTRRPFRYKRLPSLAGTASRYLTQRNTSRLTRASSYKSTAEIERDFFKSLRSF